MKLTALAGAATLALSAGLVSVPAFAADPTPGGPPGAGAAAAPAVINETKPADTSAPAEIVAKTMPADAATSAKPAATGEAKVEQAAIQKVEEKPAPPPVTLRADVNLSTQRLTVYEKGVAIHTWPISSGRAGYPTVTGNFSPIWMSKMHYSRKYDNAPMPNAVFFHGGFAIHATYATGMLGRPASHGCVRLSPSNAKTFYNLVGKHGRAQTRIAVHGSPKHSEPRVAKSRTRTTPKPTYSAFDWGFGGGSTYDSNQKAVRRSRANRAASAQSQQQPKIIYRNGQPYVYVGPQAAKKYWQKNKYSGSYASY